MDKLKVMTFKWQQITPRSCWKINHTFNTAKICVRAYDEHGIWIPHVGIFILDANNVWLSFNEDTIGFAMIESLEDNDEWWVPAGIRIKEEQEILDPFKHTKSKKVRDW